MKRKVRLMNLDNALRIAEDSKNGFYVSEASLSTALQLLADLHASYGDERARLEMRTTELLDLLLSIGNELHVRPSPDVMEKTILWKQDILTALHRERKSRRNRMDLEVSRLKALLKNEVDAKTGYQNILKAALEEMHGNGFTVSISDVKSRVYHVLNNAVESLNRERDNRNRDINLRNGEIAGLRSDLEITERECMESDQEFADFVEFLRKLTGMTLHDGGSDVVAALRTVLETAVRDQRQWLTVLREVQRLYPAATSPEPGVGFVTGSDGEPRKVRIPLVDEDAVKEAMKNIQGGVFIGPPFGAPGGWTQVGDIKDFGKESGETDTASGSEVGEPPRPRVFEKKSVEPDESVTAVSSGMGLRFVRDGVTADGRSLWYQVYPSGKRGSMGLWDDINTSRLFENVS